MQILAIITAMVFMISFGLQGVLGGYKMQVNLEHKIDEMDYLHLFRQVGRNPTSCINSSKIWMETNEPLPGGGQGQSHGEWLSLNGLAIKKIEFKKWYQLKVVDDFSGMTFSVGSPLSKDSEVKSLNIQFFNSTLNTSGGLSGLAQQAALVEMRVGKIGEGGYGKVYPFVFGFDLSVLDKFFSPKNKFWEHEDTDRTFVGCREYGGAQEVCERFGGAWIFPGEALNLDPFKVSFKKVSTFCKLSGEKTCLRLGGQWIQDGAVMRCQLETMNN